MKKQGEPERHESIPFPDNGEEMLRAELELLGREQRLLFHLTKQGRVFAMTDEARCRLRISERENFLEKLSEPCADQLRQALKKGSPVTFTDHLGTYTMYDVTSVPVSGGAVLLLTPQYRQTLLEAKVAQAVLSNLQTILAALRPVSGYESEKLNKLRDCEKWLGPLLSRPGEELCEELQKTFSEVHHDLLLEEQGCCERAEKAACRILRTLRHAEQLGCAQTPYAVPVFLEGDLAELCRQTVEAYRKKRGAPDVQIALRIQMNQNPWAVYDPSWIQSALLNLLINIPDSAKQILVTLSRIPKMIVISVGDTGPGVPSIELDHLYRACYEEFQPETYLSARYRPGLGLPLVKMIAERHGGCLMHEEGQDGEVFRLCISDRLLPEREEMHSDYQLTSSFSVLDLELSVL